MRVNFPGDMLHLEVAWAVLGSVFWGDGQNEPLAGMP